MTRYLLTLVLGMVALLASADDALKIAHGTTNDYALLADIDSLYFSADGKTLYVQPVGDGSAIGIARTDISEACIVSADNMPQHLCVAFSDGTAYVDNPYFLHGMTVVQNGAYVVATNTDETTERTTELSGTTTDGAFTYYGTYKTTIVLAGVNITSKQGAAINIQCGKRVELDIKKDTENTLIDAVGGEQKAALYCKGHLEIDKAGTLNVTGKTAHAISAKEYIQLKKSEGHINISGAVKDGIHCKQYFLGNGFNVSIKGVGDDNIQAELDGADNEDGIADGSIVINGGTYTLINTTAGSTDGTETHTAKGMNAEGNMQLNAGTISIKMSGKGGKGIRVEGTYTQGTEDGEGPTLTVATTGASYTTSTSTSTGNTGGRPGGGGGFPGGESSGADAKAIKVLGAVTIYGGTSLITTTQSGAEGLESKTSILIKGGNHYFKCYDDCINTSGIINFAGGNTVCYSNGNDAVDSNYGRSGAITISGGNVFAYTSAGSPEEGLDCDDNSNIKITGGIAISAGGSQGGGGGGGWGGSSSTSQSVGSSTQGYYLGSSPSSYKSATYYTLYNTSGEAICTYLFDAGVTNSLSLLTAPNLGKGSVTVKSGSTAPTASTTEVKNANGKSVFFLAPTVTTTTTTATVTAK